MSGVSCTGLGVEGVHKPNHYQLECKAKPARVDLMKGAPDNLAKIAILRKMTLAGH